MFSLSLTEQELNYILNAVAKQPYSECFMLIRNMEQQIAAQIEQPTAAKEAEAK